MEDTVAGAITASGTGALIGAAGSLVGNNVWLMLMPAAIVSILLVFRELRITSFRLPQVDRQTVKRWALEYALGSTKSLQVNGSTLIRGQSHDKKDV